MLGELNPLKTLKDGITENREINRKRDETHRLHEREREHQVMEHEEAMARESRISEQQQQSYDLEAARIRLEVEKARFSIAKDLIGLATSRAAISCCGTASSARYGGHRGDRS